jgi:hypothetical protein
LIRFGWRCFLSLPGIRVPAADGGFELIRASFEPPAEHPIASPRISVVSAITFRKAAIVCTIGACTPGCSNEDLLY